MVCENTSSEGYMFGRIAVISDFVKYCNRLGDVAFLTGSDGLYLLEVAVNKLSNTSDDRKHGY
jgi:hypothetical protein